MLLVNHGKRCSRCAKNGKPRKASDGDCPLFGTKGVKEMVKAESDTEVSETSLVKPDPDTEPGPKKKQKGTTALSTEGVSQRLDIKQEASEQSGVVKQDPDVKLEPESSHV